MVYVKIANKQLPVLKRFRNLASRDVKGRLYKAFILPICFIVLVSGLPAVLEALISWSCLTNVCYEDCIG